ncbi:hypothetical protein CGERO_04245 [Corynebacterium gerontici]|uniref:Uncharacterized protein n=1 Tax=Corynebacterium gerontici TaxID=2079234 RepID=A0A3G6IZT0_9CORY|nr:hypothetical protein CGERO_04245 [Corynebacterium gerontici]
MANPPVGRRRKNNESGSPAPIESPLPPATTDAPFQRQDEQLTGQSSTPQQVEHPVRIWVGSWMGSSSNPVLKTISGACLEFGSTPAWESLMALVHLRGPQARLLPLLIPVFPRRKHQRVNPKYLKPPQPAQYESSWITRMKAPMCVFESPTLRNAGFVIRTKPCTDLRSWEVKLRGLIPGKIS